MDNEEKEILQLILSEVLGLKQGQQKLEQSVQNLEQGQRKLEQSVQNLEQKVQNLEESVHDINIKLENVIEPKLQIIYENQMSIIECNRLFEIRDERIEVLETDASALKHAFKTLKQG